MTLFEALEYVKLSENCNASSAWWQIDRAIRENDLVARWGKDNLGKMERSSSGSFSFKIVGEPDFEREPIPNNAEHWGQIVTTPEQEIANDPILGHPQYWSPIFTITKAGIVSQNSSGQKKNKSHRSQFSGALQIFLERDRVHDLWKTETSIKSASRKNASPDLIKEYARALTNDGSGFLPNTSKNEKEILAKMRDDGYNVVRKQIRPILKLKEFKDRRRSIGRQPK